jgi:hypothetical protein
MKHAAQHLLIQFACDIVLVYGLLFVWSLVPGGETELGSAAVLWVPVVRVLNGDYLVRFLAAWRLAPWGSTKQALLYVAIVSGASLILAELYYFSTGQGGYTPLFLAGPAWALLTAFAVSAALASEIVNRFKR